nr:hypothetical protein [Tanacetum cinerariifolium]
MTSFGYRLNPHFAIKECSSCGALYTRDCSCSKGSVEDKILVPKLLKNYARCAKCGHPVNGPYCQGCALLREKLEEDLVTYLKYFQETFESSDDSTKIVNAPREPVVVKKDHGVNPPPIDECCCECGNALDGLYCQQCICKSCGKGTHVGYNCPPKVSIISNLEPCNQTMNNELPQTLPSFDATCYSDKENSVPCISKPNFVDESSNIFNPPPQPLIYSCEICESNAQNGQHYTPQVPFINLESGYSKTLISRKIFMIFNNSISVVISKKQEEKQIEEEQAANAQYWKIPTCCDDDDDYNSAITPALSTEETDNSLKSMLNRDSSIISSSLKIDSLLNEFVDELTLLKSIPSGINKADCHPKNEIRFSERLLYDNSSPRPPEEFVFENSNAEIESFSLSPIPIEDSDSHMEEINLFFNPNDPMPPSIEDDDNDSERDNPFLEILLHDDPIPFPDTLDF